MEAPLVLQQLPLLACWADVQLPAPAVCTEAPFAVQEAPSTEADLAVQEEAEALVVQEPPLPALAAATAKPTMASAGTA